LACAIEDAGFTIQDTIAWVHSQRFPKGKTSLKPAFEPIIVSYKPGDKRELQIDECQITYSEDNPPIAQGKTSVNSKKPMFGGPSLYKSKTKAVIGGNSSGRYPAHLVHDGSDEVLDLFPESKGQLVIPCCTDPAGIQ
jgi:hypothetical protein